MERAGNSDAILPRQGLAVLFADPWPIRAKQGIEPGKLTVHADRGSSMTSKPVAFLMADLGITKTHGRPHVSDDIFPFTMKKTKPVF
jgi:transposase InsO family protein